MMYSEGAPAGVVAAPRCVPCLKLFADTLYVDDGTKHGEEIKTAMLRLDFSYDGKRVRSRAPQRPGRDRAAELQAARVLEGLGALELSSLEDCAVSPGSPIDYVIAVDGDANILCTFAAHSIPQLRAMGWTVEIDPDYPWQVVASEAPIYVEAEQQQDWFGLELGIEIDGQHVNLLPALLELLEGAGDLSSLSRTSRRYIAVRVDEKRWLPIPPSRLKMLGKVLLEMYRDNGKLKTSQVRAPLIADLCATLQEIAPVRWIGDSAIREQAYAMALGPRKSSPTINPELLCAELRPYQTDGVAWLQHMREHGTGGILADDMGLGKTLQTIAHILLEKQHGRLDCPAMIVTLTSLIGNWQREIARFAPSLKVGIHHGPKRHEQSLDGFDVIITNYPIVARDKETLSKRPLHLLVLDEAHAVKNHDAQAAEAIRTLDARHKVCLSGTPIENHLGELWSLFDFLNPGLLGARDEFTTQFRQPIEERFDKVKLDALRERVRPFILRRTKDSVAKELPAKTCLVNAVELTGAQRELYETIRVAAHADVRAHIKQRGLAGSTIAILDALLKLRQVCCDPRLVSSEAARDVQESAKLNVLLDMVQNQLADGHRILIFSQFARMLALISESLLAKGIGHVTLTGSTPDRQKPIDAFQQGRSDVFLISLKAGGAGINLVGADTVIHYDPWWNPAAQAQATDRAHRIGQTRPVFVHDLIIAGSVEERMLGLQKHKKALANAILGDRDPNASGSFTDRDVDDLLAPLA
ncbi:MAG TPA: DEAD/DEAH box helicase [Kofleriaceae bacterium]